LTYPAVQPWETQPPPAAQRRLVLKGGMSAGKFDLQPSASAIADSHAYTPKTSPGQSSLVEEAAANATSSAKQ